MNQPARQSKRKAYFWGQSAEWLCIGVLFLKGYRILARRFKCKVGEIDLIAQKGQVICFVEVKARRDRRDALEAVSFHQQQRIMRAAEWYLTKNCSTEHGNILQMSYRFDVMAVEPWRWPTHVKDAWQKKT
ncbi:YraN family protein [Paremcibacter congregatus]|uniref:YraN family protein n=1 Tax=Paremcibacter congregatus TaxID=2043170 RepID=UPI003A8E2C18